MWIGSIILAYLVVWRTKSIVQNFILVGEGAEAWRSVEKRMLPFENEVVGHTLVSAAALEGDKQFR